MGYIPIFFDVTGRPCIVIGGGEVAARKVESLIEAGARATVVSPRLSPSLQAAAEARTLGIPINVADVPELCSFIAPAVVKRGALQIAISTSGASPAFAARIRRELDDRFGAEYALTLDLMRAARRRLHADEIAPVERMRRLTELANSALPDAIAAGDVA